MFVSKVWMCDWLCVTLDADQAFEACSASAVLQAWDTVEHVIQERIGSRVVLVKRGKREVTSLSRDFKSGWWLISLDVVRQAIRAFSWVSLVCVAGSVYELKGLPIGGVLSGLCLSVVLGKQEYEWNANRLDQNQGWVRFWFVSREPVCCGAQVC